jgi:hypothetical protein
MGEPALLAPGPGLAAMLAEADPARLDPAGLVRCAGRVRAARILGGSRPGPCWTALGKTLVHGDED